MNTFSFIYRLSIRHCLFLLIAAPVIVFTLPLQMDQAQAAQGNMQKQGKQPITFATSTDTNYLNGGIGVEEAAAMRLKAAEFPLRLTLSEGKGSSIAGASITISDHKGNTVFELPDAGPLLYIKLPNGSYRINAGYNGVSLSQTAVLSGNKGKNVYLNWKASPQDAQLESTIDNEPALSIPLAPGDSASSSTSQP